jgi:hypothetical protein
MCRDEHPVAEDELLLRAFEDGTLDAGAFGHRRHLHVAWAVLRRRPFVEALAWYRDGLLRLVERVGARDKYHETVTCAMMTLVHERMRRGGEETWEEFASANPDLFEWSGGGPLARYYERETLDSELARSVFVLPDRGLATAAPGERPS